MKNEKLHERVDSVKRWITSGEIATLIDDLVAEVELRQTIPGPSRVHVLKASVEDLNKALNTFIDYGWFMVKAPQFDGNNEGEPFYIVTMGTEEARPHIPGRDEWGVEI